MAKTKKSVDDILKGIETKKPAEVIAIATELCEKLKAEQEAHANTADEKDNVIGELTAENEKLSLAVQNAPKAKTDNGTVKIDGKEYPILLKKFQISRGDFKGIHTAESLQANPKLAAFLLQKEGGVLGAAIESKKK